MINKHKKRDYIDQCCHCYSDFFSTVWDADNDDNVYNKSADI